MESNGNGEIGERSKGREAGADQEQAEVLGSSARGEKVATMCIIPDTK